MNGNPPQTTEKKKLPGWVKLVIVLAIVGVTLSVLASVGIGILATYLSGKGGEKLMKEGVEKLIEKGIEEAGGGKADVEFGEQGLVVRDREGKEQVAIGTGQKLPAGFPSDIPVYSPSEVTGSMVMGPMTMVTLESMKSPQEVISFYQAELPSKGWTAAVTAMPEGQGFTAVYRKENRNVNLTVSPGEGGKTSIVLNYGLDQAP